MNNPGQSKPPTLIERIRDLDIHDGDRPLDRDDVVVYRWDHGSETLDVTHGAGGGIHYSGVYHPDDGCCVGNPCTYCGMVWHSEL